MKENKSILFFEPEIKGHQLDYIEHACNYYVNKRLSFSIIFVVNNLFQKILIERNKLTLFDNYMHAGIKFVEITECEANRCATTNLVKSAFSRWYIAKKYASLHNIDHLHFLFLDHLQLPLALKLNLRSNFTVSGLLFRATINYKHNSDTIIDKVRNFIKRIVYLETLKNRKVNAVFSFDPYVAEYSMKNFNNGLKVKALPDPSLFAQKYKIYKDNLINFSEEGKKMFVMFGYMQERKGILQFLNSLKYLDKLNSSKIIIYIAGKIDENIKDKVLEIEDELRNINISLKLNILDRYISDQELVSLINSSDCILAPYQRFIGSSGVILWAAGAGRPIITQDYGLLGRWVKENKLGLTINTTNPIKISEAISKFILLKNEQLYDIEKMQEFSQNNTPERFAQMMFNNFTEHD